MTLDELKADARAIVPVNDVLGLVPLDRRTIYKGIEDGAIPGIKIGRRVMILRIPFLRMLTGEIAGSAA